MMMEVAKSTLDTYVQTLDTLQKHTHAIVNVLIWNNGNKSSEHNKRRKENGRVEHKVTFVRLKKGYYEHRSQFVTIF